MALNLILLGIGALFVASLAVVLFCQAAVARVAIYGAALAVCAVALVVSLGVLVGGSGGSALALPLGIPWLQARLRLDALAAFFLVVVNFGGAAASLYAIGYGRDEQALQRVLPFFPAVTSTVIALPVRRLASHAVRRAPAWDCGFPDASHATQYTAGSFAQPIRRVFGRTAFGAAERVEMPEPGSLEPARLHVLLRDRAWDNLFEPIAAVVGTAATRLERSPISLDCSRRH